LRIHWRCTGRHIECLRNVHTIAISRMRSPQYALDALRTLGARGDLGPVVAQQIVDDNPRALYGLSEPLPHCGAR